MNDKDRAELIGCLIDVVEDWLQEKKSLSEDTDDAIIFGEDYDRLADGFTKIIEFIQDDREVISEALSWAEREVELACKREKPDRKDGEWDYGCACYESALRAYKSLLNDRHSGFSIMLTKGILNRLIDRKPLTPIEDTEDVWDDIAILGETEYQCKRMSSLFKHICSDGTVKYHDNDRTVKVIKSEDGHEIFWHNGHINHIADELFPITMPYMPENDPYKVYCEEFLCDEANGDYDTVGVLYLIKPDGTRMEINRYFKDGEGQSYIEISEAEYLDRKQHRIDKN